MKRICLVLMLASCASKPALKEEPPEELLGTWKLVRYQCEKFGFTDLGKKLAAPIREGLLEEYYRFEPDRITIRLLDRKPGGASEAYCESLFEGPLEMRQGKIVATEYKLAIREGRGGLPCPERVKFPGMQKTESDWSFRIEDQELRIYHTNLQMAPKGAARALGACQASEDLVQVFERVKAP